MSIKRS